jgi:hypothetical protein
MTGGRLPESLAHGIVNVRHSVPANANLNGMHAWHAGSNAYFAQRFGLLGSGFIAYAGLFHESPLDSGSFQAEQDHQGTVNHFLDSITDIQANVFGMMIGYLSNVMPETVGVDTAIKFGNYIPGPGEPDPEFGGTGRDYDGDPTDAWGQYP